MGRTRLCFHERSQCLYEAAIIAGILDPDQPVAAEQADCAEFVGQSARVAGQV
jgi:hypothetical protein